MDRAAMTRRVADRHLRNAVYWADRDRKYRATKTEQDSQTYVCPRCPGEVLGPTVYKRESGKSVRLLGCHSCLFLVKVEDVDGHHHNVG